MITYQDKHTKEIFCEEELKEFWKKETIANQTFEEFLKYYKKLEN